MQSINDCRAKADVHEKHFQHRFEITRDSYASALSLSLSLSNLLSKFAKSLDPEDLRRLAKPNQGQTGIPRINHVSERPTLCPMPRKNIIELPTCGMWDQQSLRSACAYVQSDQSLC